MELKPYQVCTSSEGWIPIRIPSETNDEIVYTVFTSPWQRPNENICECPGFAFRGSCKHQAKAQSKRCDWTELQVDMNGKPRFVQTPEQREAKICPRCHSETVWRLEVDEQDSAGSLPS